MKRCVCGFASLCLFALLPVQVLHAQAPSRMIGWWRMDDAPGATVLADSSGYGRNALLGTGATITDGKFGKAVRFDGTTNAWARFSSSTYLTNFTLSAWFNVPQSYTNMLFPKLIQFNTMYYQLSASTPGRFNIGLGTAPNRAEWITTNQTPFIFVTNVWTHAALVVTRVYTNATDWVARPTFYLNGIRCGTDVHGPKAYAPDTIGSGYGFFGNTGIGGTRALDGALDEVRIYNDALTDHEILALYQNRPVAVDAGQGQTCHRDSARLQGRLVSTNPYSRELAATSVWSVVSAPEGAAPVFAFPALPATAVTLPEVGTYVFRLSAFSELGRSSNEVTVVRAAGEAAGNAAPTVTTPWASTNIVISLGLPLTGTVSDDNLPTNTTQVCWSKVSGPGVVFFDNAFTNSTTAYFSTTGTYVLQLQADDGAATGSTQVTATVTLPAGNLSSGLIHWWRMDENPDFTKSYDSAGTNTLTLRNQTLLQPGKTGYGLRFPSPSAVAQAASVLTNAESMSFSLWLYFDAAYTNNIGKRILDMSSSGFWLYYSPDVLYLSARGTNGANFSWTQQGPKLASNEWVHVAVLCDWRPTASLKQSFYINGALCNTDTRSNFPGLTNLIGTLYLGGNGSVRNFDGVFDDMRVYNRLLTEEEVKTLAVDPDNNHAPVIEAQAAVTAKIMQPVSSLAAVTDDGQPLGKSLATQWSVVSGDASKVQFADAGEPGTAVTFTRSGDYVLRLDASDGELQSAATLSVKVSPTGTIFLLF